MLLALKRRYEFWIAVTALRKIGAIVITATHQLTTKDIVYRCNSADVKMVISVAQEDVLERINAAIPDCHTLGICMKPGNAPRPGRHCFETLLDHADPDWMKPDEQDLPRNDDIMLMYFTSGTTGMPKMVIHDFTYPLVISSQPYSGVRWWRMACTSRSRIPVGPSAAGARCMGSGSGEI